METRGAWVDTAGRRITDAALHRGLRTCTIAGMMGVAWWVATQGMPLTLFLEALGASGLLMGLATTVIQFAFVMQVPGALLTRRLQRRKPVWATVVLISRAIWLVPVLLIAAYADRPGVIVWATVILCAVSASLGNGVSALWFGWMAHLVPARMLGRFWGTRQTLTMASYLATMWGAGWLLDRFPPPGAGGSWKGFAIVFSVGAVLGMADILIHLAVPEPRIQEDRGTQGLWREVLAPLRQRDFRLLTLSWCVYSFAMGLVSLGIVCLKKDFHITYSQLSVLAIASSLGTLSSSAAWGYVMDRIGGRAFAAVMLALAPLAGIVWFFSMEYHVNLAELAAAVPVFGKALSGALALLPPDWRGWIAAHPLPQALWLHLIVGFIAGALYGGLGLAQLNMLSVLSARESRTMAMAVHWSAVGVIGSGGALVSGRVMDWFAAHPIGVVMSTGTPLLFFHVLVIAQIAIIWGVALPLVLKIRRGRNEPHVLRAFSQMFAVNPFRMVTNLYLMGAAVSSRTRAQAARGLGWRRNAIAVRDLVERLNDPAAEVREESLYALGRIGTPEAVAAICARLDAPESDLAPQSARALRLVYSPAGSRAHRQVGARESGDVLLRHLGDADRETRAECARALGALGDRRAFDALLAMLAGAADVTSASAAVEALGRLDDLRAAPPLIARMGTARQPVLKRTLAVALADLLGERDIFYKVLTRESQERSRAASEFVADLRRDIRRVTRKTQAAEGLRLDGEVVRLRTLLDDEQYDAGAALLYELAVAFSRLRWGIAAGPDGAVPPEAVAGHDARFSACLSYLDKLRGTWPQREETDVLLGLYLLAVNGLPDSAVQRTTAGGATAA